MLEIIYYLYNNLHIQLFSIIHLYFISIIYIVLVKDIRLYLFLNHLKLFLIIFNKLLQFFNIYNHFMIHHQLLSMINKLNLILLLIKHIKLSHNLPIFKSNGLLINSNPSLSISKFILFKHNF